MNYDWHFKAYDNALKLSEGISIYFIFCVPSGLQNVAKSTTNYLIVVVHSWYSIGVAATEIALRWVRSQCLYCAGRPK